MAVIEPIDGYYLLYDQDGLTVKLTFPAGNQPAAGFTVETKPVPSSGLPEGYTWVVNFGIKNAAGHYLPSATYHLDGSSKKSWFIYYRGQARAMNGTHQNAPGDPPIGYG